MAASNDLQQVLRPFHQRATEAEDRLARLEASLANVKVSVDSENDDLLNKVVELQKMLEEAKADQLSEREKALKQVQQVTAENAKLRYRITHLIRALEKADADLASK